MGSTRGYRYKLQPTRKQRRQLKQYLGCARFVRNRALGMAKEYEANPDHKWNTYAYINRLKGWKQDSSLSFLKEAPSQTLQQSLMDLGRGFDNFFSGQAGFPKFKKRGQNESIRFPQGFTLDQANCRVKLPKLGWIRFGKSRLIPGTVRNITTIRDGDDYFIVFTIRFVIPDPVQPPISAIGIDLGVKIFAASSDGKTYHAPVEQYKQEEAKLRRQQQRLARQKKGSKRRAKTKNKISRIHRKIRNIRQDFTHKLSSHLAKNHSLIVMEDLRVKHMSKSARGTVESPGRMVKQKSGLNRSILRQGWSIFRAQLEYKISEHGGTLLLVPAHHTSQRCPIYGFVSSENRTTQERFFCMSCGHEANADLNAAKNILARGIEIRAGHAHCAHQVNPVTGQQ